MSSAEIAAELRSRILTGGLQPGDVLPSAREITRTWNVAIATASRVHALLRAEGLATPVPGMGTLVTTPTSSIRPRARSTRMPSPQRRGSMPDDAVAGRIVAAATSIADVEGINSLTLRRVAHEVGLSPAALHRFHPSTEDLLAGMMDYALHEWSHTEDLGSWRENLISGHLALWRVFRRHPWLAPQLSITRPQMVPAALTFAEWAIRTLAQAGISPEEAFETHILLFMQLRGAAILLEPENEAESVTGIDADAWVDARLDALREISGSEKHSALRSLIGSGYVLDLDRTYERGLLLLVDGISSRVRSPQASAHKPR